MDNSSTSLTSTAKPKSPRRQSSKQVTSAALQNTRPSGSLPSSPTLPARTLHAAHAAPVKKHMAGSGTFFAESPNMEENDDAEDPHDLSFSRNHVARASMVDNLVMSLDNFPGNAFDDAPYTPRSNSYDINTKVRGRGRGHTFSSSTSSENDIQHLKATSQPPYTIPRIPVRSSVRYQKDLQKLPSIFGEDEDPTRVKVYDDQRAAAPRPPRRKKNISSGGKSDHSSNSSSIDLGHLASMNGRLGGPGNRRSRSFDFGSRQRDVRIGKSTIPAEPSFTPATFPGSDSPADRPASPLMRKTSTKSSKSAYAKKTRPPVPVSGTSKMDAVPALPSVKSVPSLSNTDSKSGTVSLHEPVAAPRPGFFRRVFGSKNPTVESLSTPGFSTKSHHGRATPVQDEHSYFPPTPPGKLQKPVRSISTDVSANKENHPVITKKSSTFFRRRKKSVSNSVPPPLPLTLSADMQSEHEPPTGTSPVSSLRAFMGPYLAEPPQSTPGHGHPHGHVRTNSMQGFFAPNLPPPPFGLSSQGVATRPKASHNRNESHSSNKSGKTLKSGIKQPATLRIPHQDSFLADSSSVEESMKRSPFDTASDIDKATLASRTSAHELNIQQRVSANSIPSATSNPRSATTRNGSWISDTVSHSSSYVAPETSSTDTEAASKNFSARRQNTIEIRAKPAKGSPFASTSDLSEEYRSAPSTPLIIEVPDQQTLGSGPLSSPVAPKETLVDVSDHIKRAQQIYDHADDEVEPSTAGIWLGDAGDFREQVRKAYMELFDWHNQDILESLRGLCDRVALKGESQVIDRMLVAFAQRWCECNPTHNFRSSDVVHSVCYAILLLNTDLHLADIGQKMTKAQFTRNALATIKRNVQKPDINKTVRASSRMNKSSADDTDVVLTANTESAQRSSEDETRLSESYGPISSSGLDKSWEVQIEAVLKAFYISISQDPLPLYGAPVDPNSNLTPSNNFLTIGSNMLRRTPSVMSKAHSETNRGRFNGESRSLGARFMNKTRSRPRLPSAPGFNSSRTSIDESSAWSPSLSSTWSKASLGKTLTSMSVDSFGTEATQADYQSSIGFANALSQAIIREDQLDLPIEDGPKAGSLLEDESLELCGAPWAKEGILKHKCHLEGVDKRSKDRNWNDCFAVVEKGYMRLFSFSMTAKSLRNKARGPAPAVVGGGNWQDNAEELWKFTLRHTIASSLPPPGYSKARPFVWALSLPTGAVHLFSVGTPDIVKEFVSTANFWSARLSKEPMMGGISNMEYGWSEAIVNRPLTSADNHGGRTGVISPRPSTQMSMRSSMDHMGGVRAKLPGDKIHINDWAPPQQSMFASQLMEVDQLRGLQTYVANVEEELQKHNDLRGLMLLAFTAKHPHSTKAMHNWERKSSYLLREIVKFRTYIDTLQSAQSTKGKIYRMRKEEDAALEDEADLSIRTDTANALMGVI